MGKGPAVTQEATSLFHFNCSCNQPNNHARTLSRSKSGSYYITSKRKPLQRIHIAGWKRPLSFINHNRCEKVHIPPVAAAAAVVRQKRCSRREMGSPILVFVARLSPHNPHITQRKKDRQTDRQIDTHYSVQGCGRSQ